MTNGFYATSGLFAQLHAGSVDRHEVALLLQHQGVPKGAPQWTMDQWSGSTRAKLQALIVWPSESSRTRSHPVDSWLTSSQIEGIISDCWWEKIRPSAHLPGSLLEMRYAVLSASRIWRCFGRETRAVWSAGVLSSCFNPSGLNLKQMVRHGVLDKSRAGKQDTLHQVQIHMVFDALVDLEASVSIEATWDIVRSS